MEESECCWERRPHSLSELCRASRLTRATMRHYEKLGIVGGADGDVDAERLGNAIVLRNLGYEPQRIAELIDADPLSPEHLAMYRQDLERRMEYERAQVEALDEQAELVAREGEVWVANRDAYYVNPTLPMDTAQGRGEPGCAAMYMPISGMGGLFEGDDPLAPYSLRLGRAVPVRHAGLIEGFSDDMPRVGGCTRAHVVARVGRSFTASPCRQDWAGAFERLRAALDERGLVPQGAAFICRSLACGGVSRVLICLPVRRANVARRLSRAFGRLADEGEARRKAYPGP